MKKKTSFSVCKSLIADSYLVRLKCKCIDDGFVIASLRGLLEGGTGTFFFCKNTNKCSVRV